MKKIISCLNNETIKRFWSKVEIRGDNDCWWWSGGKHVDGYGWFYAGGLSIRTNRFSWTVINGEIPDGLLVCHHCDNPSCVNPRHLFLGTNSDNMRDMNRKNRRNQVNVRGEDVGTSKLKSGEVALIKILIKRGIDKKEISKMFKVSSATIYMISKKTIWKHIQI